MPSLSQGAGMRRREFIGVLGGAAAWPHTARAQQPERVRRVSILMSLAADDPEGQARVMAFVQGLQQLGWTVGRNAAEAPHRSNVTYMPVEGRLYFTRE